MSKWLLFTTIISSVIGINLNAQDSQSLIEITNAYTYASKSHSDVAGVFMSIKNSSNKSVSLVSGSSKVDQSFEIHTINDENGVKSMSQIDKIEIKPQKLVELKPGGLHLMLIGLKNPFKVGQEIEITLNFDNTTPMTLKIPVKQRDFHNSPTHHKH